MRVGAGARQRRVVVVGGSIGGINAARALRTSGYAGEIVLVSSDPEWPYDRPNLSKDFISKGDGWRRPVDLIEREEAERLGLHVRRGETAVHLDPDRCVVELSDGRTLGFDQVIIATGAVARQLPGTDQAGPLSLRTLRDARRVADMLTGDGPATVGVIGGGFVGCEVAVAAAPSRRVTIFEAADRPFSAVIGEQLGQVVADLHRAHGVEVENGRVAATIRTSDAQFAVDFTDGSVREFDGVVVGIGCQPQVEWLRDSGLPLRNGVVTDEYCRVEGFPNIYAVGDVANSYYRRLDGHYRTEHWTRAFQQAVSVARTLCDPGSPTPADDAPYFWSDQYGYKLQMVGVRVPEDELEVLEWRTKDKPSYAGVFSRDGTFTAAVTLNQPRLAAWLRAAWGQGLSKDDVLERVLSHSTR